MPESDDDDDEDDVDGTEDEEGAAAVATSMSPPMCADRGCFCRGEEGGENGGDCGGDDADAGNAALTGVSRVADSDKAGAAAGAPVAGGRSGAARSPPPAAAPVGDQWLLALDIHSHRPT